jgi:threonine/homoserine/homoserine lactone efflux protein
VSPDFLKAFLLIAGVHALAVASPGPDFAIVLHQSIRFGRRPAIFTSLGIASGIFFHVAYCLFGLSWLLREHPAALEVMKYAGAAYLAWLGLKALWSGLTQKPATTPQATTSAEATPTATPQATPTASEHATAEHPASAALSPNSYLSHNSPHSHNSHSATATADTAAPLPHPEHQRPTAAYLCGLGVNILNPKVALFFIAIFTGLIPTESPFLHRAFFGVWMAGITALWFICVSCFFTLSRVRSVFLRLSGYFDIAMGLLLLFLTASLIYSSARP